MSKKNKGNTDSRFFNCALCGVSVLTEQAWNDHVTGKRHAKATENSGQKYLYPTVQQKVECCYWLAEFKCPVKVQRRFKQKYPQQQSPEKGTIRNWHKQLLETGCLVENRPHASVQQSLNTPYECGVCGFKTASTEEWNSHLEGGRHRSALKSKAPVPEPTQPPLNPAYKCGICGFNTSSTEEWNSHLVGQRHQTAIRLKGKKPELCNVCNVVMSSEADKAIHVQGKKHKFNLQRNLTTVQNIEQKIPGHNVAVNFTCGQNKQANATPGQHKEVEATPAQIKEPNASSEHNKGRKGVVEQILEQAKVSLPYIEGNNVPNRQTRQSPTKGTGKEKSEKFVCKCCNYTANHKKEWEVHIQGKNHKRNEKFVSFKRDKEDRGIYIRGFSKHPTVESLGAFFSKFGKVLNCKIQGNSATVEFAEKESVQKCLSKPVYFDGVQLRVKKRELRETSKRAVLEEMKDGIDHVRVCREVAACEGDFLMQLDILLRGIQQPFFAEPAIICRDLQAVFSVVYPGCKAYLFGSSVTGLGLRGSDVDVFLSIPNWNYGDASEGAGSPVNKARQMLQRSPLLFYNVLAIPQAKTPIVKFIHRPTKCSCDLSFKNGLGTYNSSLISFYLSIDARLRPMILILKYWAKKKDLTGPGKLSNYALVLLALFYLQQTSPPLVPCVSDLQKSDNKVIIDDWECSFEPQYAGHTENVLNIFQLISGFFSFYSEFFFSMKVICPLIGEALPKSAFSKAELLPEALWRYKENVFSPGAKHPPLKVKTPMCLQDPFELNHCVTAGASARAVDSFKTYCLIAANVCGNVLRSNQVSQRFLKTLLTDETKPRPPLVWKGNTAFIRLPMEQFVWGMEKQIEDYTTERSVLLYWFKTIYEIVLDILRNIMKVDITEVELLEQAQQMKSPPSRQRKVLKLEGQSDVSIDQANATNSSASSSEVSDDKWLKIRKLHCSGKFNVLHDRKSAAKPLKLPQDLDSAVREETISNHIVELVEQKLGPQKEPLVKFICVFRPEVKIPQVVLELQYTDSKVHIFKSFASYMQSKVPVFVKNYLLQRTEVKQKKPEVKQKKPEVKQKKPEVKQKKPEVKHEILEVKHEIPEVKHEIPEVKQEIQEELQIVREVKQEIEEEVQIVQEVKQEIEEEVQIIQEAKQEIEEEVQIIQEVKQEIKEEVHIIH